MHIDLYKAIQKDMFQLARIYDGKFWYTRFLNSRMKIVLNCAIGDQEQK